MTTDRPDTPRLGFFTRLLDDVPPLERYRNALAQFVRAEELGFDTAWVAQHHFHPDEGGLPSPFVLLAQAAAQTSRLTLATGVVTLPLEQPLRVAEDAAVLWLLADGRFELGIGSGATPSSYPPFGHDPQNRAAIYATYKAALLRALGQAVLTEDGGTVYPAAPQLLDTLWEATFSASSAARIGADGHGLMLSRIQPRHRYTATSSLGEQVELVDAYRTALPAQVPARILASRSVLVVDTAQQAAQWRARGVERSRRLVSASGVAIPHGPADQELAVFLDLFVGTVPEVLDRLGADPILGQATDLVFQPHPIDPPHQVVLRSLELIATQVAPALGWTRTRGLS